MEKSKKTEVITFRTTKEVKLLLEKIANKKDWTVSQLCERIISKYATTQEEVKCQ